MRPMILLLFVATLSAFTWSKKPIEPEIKPIPYPPIVSETPPVDPTPVEEPKTRMALYWENTTEAHPERAPWSDELISEISKDISIYDSAEDIVGICPKWKLLTNSQKVKVIGEFYVALAYHESGFNPKTSSVDVGNKWDRNSYSDGLFQVSGNDSAAKKYGYTYKELLEPIPNIRVATEIFRRQIKNCGKLILPNSSKCRYFATILEGNKYNKIPDIKKRILKHGKTCE